ncbi:MAG: 2-dehydropantoate 2-reductase [Porticoccaceae bacterium]
MRVVVLGAGGLGSLLGGQLARTGVDVTLIARPAHADAINTRGLTINTKAGPLLIKNNLQAVTEADQASGHFDYMILAVKSKDNETALAGAESLKDRVETVFSVQNSVVKEDVLGDWLGDKSRVLGASTIEAGTLVEPGVVVTHATSTVASYFGEMDGSVSPRAQKISDAFSAADLPCKAVDCIRQVIWEKLVQIANAAGWSVSALIGNSELTVADGMALRDGAEHYIALAKELLAVNRAMGYRAQGFYAPVSKLKQLDESDDFEADVLSIMALGKQMLDAGMNARTSMHVDVLAGKKTEIEYILKPFIEEAAEFNIEVPTVKACYRIIKVLDNYLK